MDKSKQSFSTSKTEKIKEYFDSIAIQRNKWKEQSKYYHQKIEQLFRFLIPEGKKVLEIGCSTGDLLDAVKPRQGLGIDISEEMIKFAKQKHKGLNFKAQDAQNLQINETFDYVIMTDAIGNFEDVQRAFEQLHKVSYEKTRIIITYYNFLWEPILNLAEKIGFKMPQPLQSWLTGKDIENLLFLGNFEVIKKGSIILIPIYIPFISNFFNKYIAHLPIFKNLCLTSYFIVRKMPNIYSNREYSVSVIIPARNEQGSIEQAVTRMPKLGKSTEIIFVEGGSKDDTLGEIKRVIEKYKNKKSLILINQGKGVGKGDAVRKGFAKASGEVLMILDADLTVTPEELPKFYQALRSGKAEFIMGSRLVYPMEKEAMRFLNILGNKFFGLSFSYLLDTPIKDTLCGTKVLFRRDYEEIANNRSYFGDFDPFGDFDLIFGAAKLNQKILEIPIRYKARFYGTTNISRFRHGLLLFKMVIFAARKFKFI